MRQVLDSGYDRVMCRLKDPQTDQGFDFDFGLSNMVHRRILLCDLKEILVLRISGLTLEESTLYVPHNDDEFTSIDVNDFITHVNNLRVDRSAVRLVYHNNIKLLANNAMSN